MKHKLGTLKITKKLFTETIEAFKKQSDHDNMCCDAFNIILPDDRVMGYDNGTIKIALINLLKLSFKDESEWIDYFLYDLDFGADYKEGCATEKNGKNIDLSTADALYEFLVKK